MPGCHAGRSPRNKGLHYPADPPKVEEIIAVMHAAGDGPHGRRLRGQEGELSVESPENRGRLVA